MARTKRRKSTTVRLAVASIAVLGIGAAITTAAWTDQAWFTTSASSAEIELYGALADNDGNCPAASDGVYKPADDLSGAVAVTLGAGAFDDLVPGQTKSVDICLWNGSTVPLSVALEAITPTTDDSIFTGTGAATIGVRDGASDYATQTLNVGVVKPLSVRVVTPNDWDESYQDQTSGTITITFTGSTVAS